MTTTINLIRDRYPEAMLADGFDDAIVGVLITANSPPRVVYELERMIEIVQHEGVSREEAEEHLLFNTLGASIGPQTPLYISIENTCEVECGR